MNPNVYFLYGNDEFAISRRLKEFEAVFPDPTCAEMNTAHLEARTMTETELNNAVNAVPFLAPNRLIILANPSDSYLKIEQRKKFEDFISKSPETAILVIYEHLEIKNYRDKHKQEKMDEKHWLVKWGKKAGVRLERYALPAAWEMTGWITSETRQQGGTIEPVAAAKLAEMVGVDTRQAGQEIAKLLAYANWERQLSLADVESVSLLTAQESVFDFVDNLANGDGQSAQYLLQRLLENEDPFALWGMVIRQFRLLLQAREVLDARGSKEEVAQALGVHPFVAEKTTTQARAFTLLELERIYHELLEIDEGVKTSQITLELALDMLVVEQAKLLS
jgi:DNA polymerase-3 subunit delta